MTMLSAREEIEENRAAADRVQPRLQELVPLPRGASREGFRPSKGAFLAPIDKERDSISSDASTTAAGSTASSWMSAPFITDDDSNMQANGASATPTHAAVVALVERFDIERYSDFSSK